MSQAGIANIQNSSPTIATNYVTDAGTAVASANTIKILGGTNSSTSASGNTITINSTSSSVETITGDSGGALSPTLGNINLLGSGSITTSGSASTMTVQLTGLTNHALLAGAGTSTITKLSVGTNNSILMGNTGADPAFTTSGTPYVSGISFDSGSNTLSNYTQGTFTPTITSDGTPPTGVTYNYNRGHYTRIGNLVHCDFQMGMSGYTAGTGNVLVNLPVTTAANFELPVGSVNFNNINFGTAPLYCNLACNQDAATAQFYVTKQSDVAYFIQSTSWNSFLTMSASVTYLA